MHFVQLPRWVPFMLGEGEVIIRSSTEIVGKIIVCLNVELELVLIAVQNFSSYSMTTWVEVILAIHKQK